MLQFNSLNMNAPTTYENSNINVLNRTSCDVYNSNMGSTISMYKSIELICHSYDEHYLISMNFH